MNILCIGDVVGSVGCQFLRAHLPALKKTKAIDLVIANGENSADGNGITPASAEHLLDSGVDVITTGNHSFRRRESYDLYDTWDNLLRPANFPSQAPGKGLCVVDKGRVRVAVINLMGTVYLSGSQSFPLPRFSHIGPEERNLCNKRKIPVSMHPRFHHN